MEILVQFHLDVYHGKSYPTSFLSVYEESKPVFLMDGPDSTFLKS